MPHRQSLTALAATLGVAAALSAAPAYADEAEEKPFFSGEISIEVQNDYLNDNGSGPGRNELSTTIEPSFALQFTPELSLHAGLTLESVADAGEGDNRAFEQMGLYLKELTLNYDEDRFGVFVGKFTPNFGKAWDMVPGVYGTDFAEDYEFAERLGFGGSVNLGDEETGTHALSFSAFAADGTALSRSLFKKRDRLAKWRGGPSNTQSLNSFALALDGSEMPVAPGLGYHVGLISQKTDLRVDDTNTPVNAEEVANQNGGVASLFYALELAEDVTLTPLAEWATFSGFEGEEGVNRDYMTLALGLEYGNWNLGTSWTGRHNESATGEGTRDHMFQVSGGYRFDMGLGVDVGWKRAREDGAMSSTFGALVSYVQEF